MSNHRTPTPPLAALRQNIFYLAACFIDMHHLRQGAITHRNVTLKVFLLRERGSYWGGGVRGYVGD